MTEIKFDSSEQMWNTLNEKAIDLYALPDKEHELGIYIALCNDFGTLYYYECDLETAKEAVSLIGNKAQSEFSGNVSLETSKSIAEIGVGFISVGALTHSAKILDLSMKNLKPLN